MNMHHCRYENTFNDMQQILNDLDGGQSEELSTSEQRYLHKLIDACAEFLELHGFSVIENRDV